LLQILEGISDVRDESDRTGMRVVIEVYSLESGPSNNDSFYQKFLFDGCFASFHN
jgi:DNA gyrase/topoisomerase IV subunit A